MPVAWLQGKFSHWSDDTDVVLIYFFFQCFCSLCVALGMVLSSTIQKFLKCEFICIYFFTWVVFKYAISPFSRPGSFLLFDSLAKFISPCFCHGMLSLWKSVWCPKSDTITSDAEEIACEEADRNQLSIKLCWRLRNSEWDLNSNWRIQNLNSYGIFPRTGHKETQDVVSWSVLETVLRLMDMVGHFTIIYCLQVCLGGKKKKRKLNRYELHLRFWFENRKHLTLVGAYVLCEFSFHFLG